MPKNQCVLHINNLKRKLSTTPFTIDSDAFIKDIGIKLTKENYTQNNKTWLKEIPEGTDMEILSWIKRFHVVNTSVLPMGPTDSEKSLLKTQ